jgi:hypothetical protein
MAEAMLTVAVQEYDCPKCKQPAGSDCRMPGGSKKWPPHRERADLVPLSRGIVSMDGKPGLVVGPGEHVVAGKGGKGIVTRGEDGKDIHLHKGQK